MQIDIRELRRLSNLELSKYAGELDAIEGRDGILVARLAEAPVEATMVVPRDPCDERLYRICRRRAGRYDSFELLRGEIMGDLAQRFEPPGWNLLSVLFDGIYIGEYEDLYNIRAGEPQRVIYPVEGLGVKVADIRFL